MCTYFIYLPNSDGKLDLCHKSHSIIDCLLYAYGCGDFKITNNRGLSFNFKSENYTNLNGREDFFVMLEDLLTTKELDKFKKKLRTIIY